MLERGPSLGKSVSTSGRHTIRYVPMFFALSQTTLQAKIYSLMLIKADEKCTTNLWWFSISNEIVDHQTCRNVTIISFLLIVDEIHDSSNSHLIICRFTHHNVCWRCPRSKHAVHHLNQARHKFEAHIYKIIYSCNKLGYIKNINPLI